MTDVNLILAFCAGFLSFLSPCCLPLYPAFLSYITGVSLNEVREGKGLVPLKSLLHTSLFLLGFSVIFIAIGYGTTVIGSNFITYQDLIRQLGALALILFGFMMIGLITPKFLLKSYQFTFVKRPAGYVGSILIGIVFAAGWTPCTGPILAAVIGLAATNPTSALPYMIAYVIGFAIPFFVMSFFITKIYYLRKYGNLMVMFGGYVMIFLGIILYFDLLTRITAIFIQLTGGFLGW